MSKLTAKQKRFVEAYCRHLNASKAAREAGYAEASARVEGHRLLTNANISAAINSILSTQGMSVDEGIRRLTDWGRGTLEPFVTEEGFIDITSDEAQENIGLLKKVKQTKKEIKDTRTGEHLFDIISTEIELHDPKDAVSKLLEAHGKIKPSDNSTTITIFQLPDNGR